MTIRKQTKRQVDEAIAAGSQPSIPRNGLGLTLRNGRRRTGLVDAAGNLSAAEPRTKHRPKSSTTTKSQNVQAAL